VIRQDNKYDYLRSYAKYFGITFQMIILIVMGGFGGRALDNYFHIGTHIFAIVLIILATILSLFLLFKTLFNK
jgi:hypothetical protein